MFGVVGASNKRSRDEWSDEDQPDLTAQSSASKVLCLGKPILDSMQNLEELGAGDWQLPEAQSRLKAEKLFVPGAVGEEDPTMVAAAQKTAEMMPIFCLEAIRDSSSPVGELGLEVLGGLDGVLGLPGLAFGMSEAVAQFEIPPQFFSREVFTPSPTFDDADRAGSSESLESFASRCLR